MNEKFCKYLQSIIPATFRSNWHLLLAEARITSCGHVFCQIKMNEEFYRGPSKHHSYDVKFQFAQ